MNPDDITDVEAARVAWLRQFMLSALSGSAASVASRHDFTAAKMAHIAMEIAKAALVELESRPAEVKRINPVIKLKGA